VFREGYMKKQMLVPRPAPAVIAASISFSVLAPFLAAGEEAWVRIHDEPSGSCDTPLAIAAGADGDVFVTGFTTPRWGNNGDIVTVRFDAAGNQIWAARYSGPGGPIWDRDIPCAIALGAGGNVHVAGTSVGAGTSTDFILVTYDPDGNERWIVRWDGPSGGLDEAAGMAVDAAGNIYVAGTSSGDGGDEMNDIVTLKVSPEGTLLWAARYGSTFPLPPEEPDPWEGEDHAGGIGLDAAGNAYVSGLSRPHGGGESTTVTVKYDPEGNELWTAGVVSGTDLPGPIAVDGLGNSFVAGTYHVDDNYLFAAKHGPDGAETWVAWTDVALGYVDMDTHLGCVNAIAADGSGRLTIAGSSWEGLVRPAVVRLDPDGSIAWARIGELPGRSFDIYLESTIPPIALALDGSGCSYLGFTPDDGAMVAKLDPDGKEVWRAVYSGPGAGVDEHRAIVLDGAGNLRVACSSATSGQDSDYAVLTYGTAGNLLGEARWGGEQRADESASAVLADEAGSAYVGGESWTAATSRDFLVAKYDPEGKLLWAARHDNRTRYDLLGGIALDGEGGVRATGCSYPDTILDDDESELVTVRWDAGGRRMWSAALTTGMDSVVRRGAIAVDRAGNVLVTVAGRRPSPGHSSSGILTVKYGPGGDLLWEAFEGFETGSTESVGIAIDRAGCAYVLGYNSSGPGGFDIEILKYAPGGERLWAATYDSPEGWWDMSSRIAIDPAGDIVVLGETSRDSTRIPIVLKFNPDGNLIRATRLPGPEEETWYLNEMALDARGTICAAGCSDLHGAGINPMLAVKLDPLGNILWTARHVAVGSEENAAYGLALDRAGNVFVTGTSKMSASSSRISTVRYSPRGEETWSRLFEGPRTLAFAAGVAADGAGNVYVAATSADESSDAHDLMTLKYEFAPAPFIRGDCDGDGQVTGSLTDAVFLLQYLFMGGAAPPCLSACDANGDGEAVGQVTDALYILWYGFLGGPPPPPPYPSCAIGPEDGLGCLDSPACLGGG
jgi:hypothetical protein